MVTSERGEPGQSIARVTRDTELSPMRHVRHVCRDTCGVMEAGHVAVTWHAPWDTRLPLAVPTPKLVTAVLQLQTIFALDLVNGK